MTKSERILALCESATQAEQYRWEQPLFAKDAALKDLSDACNPAEVKRMVEVMLQMKDALAEISEDVCENTYTRRAKKGIAAFDAWQGGE